jgi:hypothetical protein
MSLTDELGVSAGVAFPTALIYRPGREGAHADLEPHQGRSRRRQGAWAGLGRSRPSQGRRRGACRRRYADDPRGSGRRAKSLRQIAPALNGDRHGAGRQVGSADCRQCSSSSGGGPDNPVVRIAVTQAAFKAIARRLPLEAPMNHSRRPDRAGNPGG